MSTNLKFITGFSGEAHIKPSMDAQWHSASSGKETFVYDYGEKFDLTVNQATSTISIKDGIGQIQGRLFIIEESLIETISYPNVPPEVGLTRIDTVVLHWGTSTRIINGETVTINTCEFEYKKNPLANGQPETFAETDLNLGDTDAYYPMWHVTWTENGIQEVEEIFTVVDKGVIPLDTTAPSGTVDGDLYEALTALGWEDEVISNGGLNQKELSTKLIERIGAEYFTLTGYAGFDNAIGYGFYDKSTDTVRLYMYGADSENISTSTVLYTVPSAYRPPQNIGAPMMFATTAGSGAHYATVYTNGEVKQTASSTLRQFMAFCEYQLHI